MAEKFIKPIREQGIIISKTYKEAKPARTDFNGKEWPATEEQYLIQVMSCDEDDFDKEYGIANGTLVDYPVEQNVFIKAKFGMWAKVKYKVSQFGTNLNKTPLSLELIDKGANN